MNEKHHTRFLKRLLILLSLLLITAFGTITLLTQAETRRILRRNAIETGVRSVRTSSEFLELYMEQLSQLFNNLYTRADIYKLLHESTLSSADSYRVFLFLRSLFFLPKDTKLYQIYMDLGPSGESYIIRETGSSYGPSRYHIQIPGSLAPGEVFGEGPHLASSYGYSLSSGSPQVYSFHWNIYNTARTEILGTISFDVEVDALTKLVFSWDESHDTVHYLLDGDYGIIYTDGIPLSQQETKRIISECTETGWSHYAIGQTPGTALYSAAVLDTLRLSILRVVPDRILFSESDRLLKQNILLSVVFMAAFLLIMAGLVRQLLTPIRGLSRYAAAVRRNGIGEEVGDYVRYDRKDEVGELVEYTGTMMENVRSLFRKQEQLSRAQRTAEARLLLAQINPHFLYNALQSIGTLALQHGDRDTYRYISMLGSRMQYSMNLEQAAVELRQEFRYVESYLELQNVRFGYCLSSEIRLSPEAESVSVPKMILQPLAENAFKHGQLCRAEGARFLLTGEILPAGKTGQDSGSGALLEIVMENNGLDCPADRMEEMNRVFREEIFPDRHDSEGKGEGLLPASPEDAAAVSNREAAIGGIGLRNVLYRLRLYHGDGVQMIFSRPEAGGVRVTLRIPL